MTVSRVWGQWDSVPGVGTVWQCPGCGDSVTVSRVWKQCESVPGVGTVLKCPGCGDSVTVSRSGVNKNINCLRDFFSINKLS